MHYLQQLASKLLNFQSHMLTTWESCDKHMDVTCSLEANHMSIIWKSYAQHMFITCIAHAYHMFIHENYMFITWRSKAKMQYLQAPTKQILPFHYNIKQTKDWQTNKFCTVTSKNTDNSACWFRHPFKKYVFVISNADNAFGLGRSELTLTRCNCMQCHFGSTDNNVSRDHTKILMQPFKQNSFLFHDYVIYRTYFIP